MISYWLVLISMSHESALRCLRSSLSWMFSFVEFVSFICISSKKAPPPPNYMNSKFVFSFVIGYFAFTFTSWSSKPSSFFNLLTLRFVLLVDTFPYIGFWSVIFSFCLRSQDMVLLVTEHTFGISIFSSWMKKCFWFFIGLNWFLLKNYFKSFCYHLGRESGEEHGI